MVAGFCASSPAGGQQADGVELKASVALPDVNEKTEPKLKLWNAAAILAGEPSSDVVAAHHPLSHGVLRAYGSYIGVVLQLAPTYISANFVEPVVL